MRVDVVRGLRAAALAVLLAAAGGAAAQAPISDPRQLEARLARVERSLSGSTLVQMHDTLQGLQREVRELRGELELQRHEIGQLKQRQRELYLDLDRRLQQAERGGGVPPMAAPDYPGPDPQALAGIAPVPAPAASAPPPGAVDASAAPAPPAPVPGSVPAPAAAPVPAPAAGTPDAGTPSVASIDPAAEQQAYRAAFDLLKSGQFSEATAALGQFLQDYPNGRFADNAQYWLGESHYVSREFDPALAAFQKLLSDYPDSPKRSHALLKIGFIHDEQGRPEQAREVLTDLVQRYPQSTAASLAEKRLKRLKQP